LAATKEINSLPRLLKQQRNAPIPATTRFTPLQQEMLRLYALDLPEADLLEIKDMIGNYLLEKMQNKVDAFVEQNNLMDADFERWLNEKS
jgi:hypothetical protein